MYQSGFGKFCGSNVYYKYLSVLSKMKVKEAQNKMKREIKVDDSLEGKDNQEGKRSKIQIKQ